MPASAAVRGSQQAAMEWTHYLQYQAPSSSQLPRSSTLSPAIAVSHLTSNVTRIALPRACSAAGSSGRLSGAAVGMSSAAERRRVWRCANVSESRLRHAPAFSAVATAACSAEAHSKPPLSGGAAAAIATTSATSTSAAARVFAMWPQDLNQSPEVAEARRRTVPYLWQPIHQNPAYPPVFVLKRDCPTGRIPLFPLPMQKGGNTQIFLSLFSEFPLVHSISSCPSAGAGARPHTLCQRDRALSWRLTATASRA